MKNLIICLVLICLGSCGLSSEETGNNMDNSNIFGTWAGCDEQGYYLEIHFSDNIAMTCHEEFLDFSFIIPYSIWKDSIYYYNHVIKDELPDWFLLKGNKLYTQHDSVNKASFMKISDSPLYPLNCNLNYGKRLDSISKIHYDKMFWRRKHDCICPQLSP